LSHLAGDKSRFSKCKKSSELKWKSTMCAGFAVFFPSKKFCLWKTCQVPFVCPTQLVWSIMLSFSFRNCSNDL
jgi:hypothetical protein